MNQHRLTIVETKEFAKRSKKLLDNDEKQALSDYLQAHPEAGDMVSQGKGIRKLRWAGSGRGKRGGVRIIYYVVDKFGVMLLMTVYAKNAKSDLTHDELQEWVEAVQLFKSSLEKQHGKAE